MAQTVSRSPGGLAAHDLTVRGTVLLGCLAMAVVTGLDLADGHLGLLFSLGFVLIVVTLPLAIDVHQLFPAGILPPLLLLGTLLVVCVFRPAGLTIEGVAADAGLITRYIASIVDHGLTLVIGHGLALAVIVWRILADT